MHLPVPILLVSVLLFLVCCSCCSCCSCCCELYVSVSSDESDKSDDDGDDDSENGCVAFSSSDETVRISCNCCSCCCNCCSCCCSCCCSRPTTVAKYVSGRRRNEYGIAFGSDEQGASAMLLARLVPTAGRAAAAAGRAAGAAGRAAAASAAGTAAGRAAAAAAVGPAASGGWLVESGKLSVALVPRSSVALRS